MYSTYNKRGYLTVTHALPRMGLKAGFMILDHTHSPPPPHNAASTRERDSKGCDQALSQ